MLKRASGRVLVLFALVGVFALLSGCSWVRWRALEPPDPPLKLSITQVKLVAPVSKSKQIHSFEKAPAPEDEPRILAQLVDEVETKAVQALITSLARQPGFIVLPPGAPPLYSEAGTSDVLLNMPQGGAEKGSAPDLLISGRILDYGAVRWQYWAAGLALHATAELVAVGLASAWNPLAVAGYLAYDLATDVPLWYGGAQVLGWVFRPVRVEVEAWRMGCAQPIWTEQVLVIRVPGKTLAAYPAEERRKKEVQLGVNLDRAMAQIADVAGQTLRMQPCPDQHRPAFPTIDEQDQRASASF